MAAMQEIQGIGHAPLGAQRPVKLLKQDRQQTGADKSQHYSGWNK